MWRALSAFLLLFCACGNDAVAVEKCRTIEHARCRWAKACGVNLDMPVRRSKSTSPVDDCYRYYDDACLHGLPVAEPGSAEVQACVDAIDQGDCNTILRPETNDACKWLIPPPDAGAADTTDAGQGG